MLSNIERSIDLAFDTDIKNIVVTGDLNLDLLKPATSKKLLDIATQYNMSQIINEPTHFTESSSSLIDVYLVSSECSVNTSGVGDPFLDQQQRYHCPVYCLLHCNKPHAKSFKRLVWKYDQCNFDNMRRDAAAYNWDSLENNDIDTYANNITQTIISLSKKHIPNKTVTIRQSDPPWMHNEIRKCIRKRKRAYDKAKKSNNEEHWNKYKTLRNKTTHLLRNAKSEHTKKLSEKLRNQNLNTSDYWKRSLHHGSWGSAEVAS